MVSKDANAVHLSRIVVLQDYRRRCSGRHTQSASGSIIRTDGAGSVHSSRFDLTQAVARLSCDVSGFNPHRSAVIGGSMARLKRLVVPRIPHHVSQRVVAGGSAFVDATDCEAFVSSLRLCSAEHQVSVLAYALLNQQVHLILIPERVDSLGKMMQALTRQYVGPFNRRHARRGTLWQARFSSAPVQSTTHLLDCVVYAEQAPQRAGFLGAAFEYPWSSACHHAGLRSEGWLAAMPADSGYWKLGNTPFERDAAYRRLLEQPLIAREIQRIDSTVLKGWALGSAEFLAEIGASVGRRASPAPRGRPPLGRR